MAVVGGESVCGEARQAEELLVTPRRARVEEVTCELLRPHVRERRLLRRRQPPSLVGEPSQHLLLLGQDQCERGEQSAVDGVEVGRRGT